jgi:hypothetical protein
MATHNIFATWDVGNTHLVAVFFNDDNEWLLADGSMEEFDQDNVSDYFVEGSAVGTGLIAGAIYTFTFTVPTTLPMALNFAVFDSATGDRAGGGTIRFSATGEVRYEVLPTDS